MPHNACRSGTRALPSTSFGPGFGSNGVTNNDSSPETTHGRS